MVVERALDRVVDRVTLFISFGRLIPLPLDGLNQLNAFLDSLLLVPEVFLEILSVAQLGLRHGLLL